jgi:uridine kinase
MAPSTGYIAQFKLIKYDDGAILMHPTKYSPFEVPDFVESPKIAEIYKETEAWGKIMDIGYVSNLNALIENGGHKELIQIAEALHEKKIATIADMITQKKKRVILIAGPSSSGKTTFANRLRLQLKVNGLHPITISTDNYFVNRELTPKDEHGELDFESLKAVDVALFNTHIMKLLDGESVDLPVFDFHEGKRTYRNKPIMIDEDQPIIIEGIHGLNEKLSCHIFKRDKFKIYVSALTQLNIDEHNRIPTTQTRLLRRIVRDNQFRGHSALKTINMWNSVRRGEERNIFPFQEEADVMFNTALPYELAVLKKHAEPLLNTISQDEPAYGEAVLLLKFLSYFKSIEEDELVPNVSILKEFIGGSGFDV